MKKTNRFLTNRQDSLERWTVDELDVDKPLAQLPTFIEDRDALVEQLFEIVNRGRGLDESLPPSSRLQVSFFTNAR